jgi:ABC-type glycerol-3-phosphate transport system substrate-binding protein
MKHSIRRFLSVVLVSILVVTLFSGCSSKSSTDTPAASNTPAPTAASGAEAEPPVDPDSDNPWAAFDTEKLVNITFYVLGTKDADMQRVVDKANERMKKLINTTVEVIIIPLADYPTKYPLLLAGGEDVDLIFCAPWLFFSEQADRGAYMELTDDFLNKWMPETMKTQLPLSWKQAMYKDKLYVVPRNESDFEQAYGVVVRKDMREM